jgi:hypothetical protein
MPGLRRPVGSPDRASTSRWPVGSSAVDTDGRTDGGLTAVVPIARAAPRARQGALPKGLLVAVHHLGPLLLRPKEITPPAGG